MDTSRFAPESLAVWKVFQEKQLKPYYELPTIEAARERSRLSSQLLSGTYDFKGSRQEIFVPSTEVTDGIPLYVYRGSSMNPDPAIYIYFHGGGLTVGSRDSVDVMCKKLIDDADGSVIIVNVEYRLAPECPLPACINDGSCVTNWILQNKERVGGSAKSEVGVGGDSGGGTIAAAVAHECPGLAFQILMYPHVIGKGRKVESFKTFAEGPILTQKLIDWFEAQAIPKGLEEDPIWVSMNRERFDKLPPCLFIVAEIDPVRDESYEYAKKLTAAGVYNELLLVKGALHAFYTSPGAFKELTKEPYARTVKFIKKYGNA